MLPASIGPTRLPVPHPERLRRIAHVALDMDGTIYKGGTLFSWTLPFLAQLRELGIGYSFLTNNPSKSIPDYLTHLARMGLSAAADELYSSAQATIDFLASSHPAPKRLFVLGTPSMQAEFKSAGFELASEDSADEPDAVVVGFDLTLSYVRLCRAAWWIQQRKPYVATNPDRVCPTDLPTVLVDCGSICSALREATGRMPDAVLGKPDPSMLNGILERRGLQPDQIAMVGDRIYTDILMAQRARALGVLVLSGEATASDAARAAPPPDMVVPSLAEFGAALASAREASILP
ncbi:hydrolase [Opitutaceae bacterium EW11]|nr:hydrolase [Opitutaceae bacterium EW11]